MYSKNCKYCDSEFQSSRSDAGYCSDTCRTKYNKEKREHEAETAEVIQSQKDERTKYEITLQTEIDSLEDILRFGRNRNLDLSKLVCKFERNLIRHKGRIRELQASFQDCSDNLAESIELTATYDAQLRELQKAMPQGETTGDFVARFQKKLAIEILLNQQVEATKSLQQEIKEVRTKYNKAITQKELREKRIGEVKQIIAKNEREIEKVKDEIREAQVRLLPPKPQHVRATLMRPFKAKGGPPPQTKGGKQSELTGGELREMQFNTFMLPSELGQFLGQLERNKLAFALTGDSGAGKSNFSFAMVSLFGHCGHSVIYYSLEEGVNRLTQEKLVRFQVPDSVVFSDLSKLSDIRKNAGSYDVVAVDSFNQLEIKAEEFEKLRQDFPDTIFIMIFQKTNAGTIRGGSSIKYNSAATIDVVLRDDERVAIMEKSRYGTQGWEYSITHNSIIKGDWSRNHQLR